MKLLPSFQQVIQEGESVQIMWILEQPVGRILVVDELVLAVARISCSLPYQSTSPSRMSLGTRLLGMNEGWLVVQRACRRV